MSFWHDMKKEFPKFGRRNFLVLGIRGGLYLAPRFERAVRDESYVWFRDTRGNFIYPDKVLAWAEVPPFDCRQTEVEEK